MNKISADIHFAHKRINEHKEQKTLLLNRWNLLSMQIGEIKKLIADGNATKEVNIALNKLQEERAKTQNEIQKNKIALSRWNETAVNLEKNLLDHVRSHGDTEHISTMIPAVLIINDLKIMQDDYSSFASDHTRVNSMRLMAAKISEELGHIIKTRSI